MQTPSKRPCDPAPTSTPSKHPRPSQNDCEVQNEEAGDLASCVIELRYISDGSAVLTTPDVQRIIATLTGKPLLHERQQVIYDGTAADVEKDPLNVFSLRKF